MSKEKARARPRKYVAWVVVAAVALLSIGAAASVATAQGGPLPPWERTNLPPAKAALLKKSFGPQNRTPVPRTPGPPAATPIPIAFVPGITTPSPEFPNQWPRAEFSETSAWRGVVGTVRYAAFAGSRPDKPLVSNQTRHPVVRVYTVDPNDGAMQFVGQYDAPFADGELTIVGGSGSALQLQWSGGQTINFDVLTHQFH